MNGIEITKNVLIVFLLLRRILKSYFQKQAKKIHILTYTLLLKKR